MKKYIKDYKEFVNESIDYKNEFKKSIGSTEDLKKAIIDGFKKGGFDIKITSCDGTEGDDDSVHRYTVSCGYESVDGKLSGKFDLDIETIGGDDPTILFGGTIKKGNEINGRERIQLRSGRRGKNLKDISSHITNSVKKIS